MSYPQNRIFTPIRNQPLTGRNANIQPTMYKRKQIFQKVSVERFQTPFSGYSFTGSSLSESSVLARSQVSQFSQQNVIRLIKQQLQKNGLNTTSQTSQQNLKNKNELNILRIEVRSIKESYHELNKSIKRKFDQQNQMITLLRKDFQSNKKSQSVNGQEINSIIDQKIKQLERDMAGKTRQVFSKTQEDLRKQITNYVNRQCIPRSFLDDLDKQLSQLDNRIVHLQGEYESSNHKNMLNSQSIKVDKDSSVILNSGGSELKLNKLQRDFQNIRKILDEKSQKIKQLDELIQMSRENQLREFKQIKQYINQTNLQLKKQIKNSKELVEEKIQIYKKSLVDRIQNQIQSLTKKIDQESIIKSIAAQNIDDAFDNIGDLQNSLKSKQKQKQKQKQKNNQDNNMNNSQSSQLCNKKQQILSQSLIIQGETSSIVSQMQKQSPMKKNAKKITITFGAPNNNDKAKPETLAISNVEQFNAETFAKQKQLSGSNISDTKLLNTSLSNSLINQNQPSQLTIKLKKIYKVDRNGYLMDHENKYLLSSSNSMIKISEQQIINMQQTNLIKIQRWIQGVKE